MIVKLREKIFSKRVFCENGECSWQNGFRYIRRTLVRSRGIFTLKSSNDWAYRMVKAYLEILREQVDKCSAENQNDNRLVTGKTPQNLSFLLARGDGTPTNVNIHPLAGKTYIEFLLSRPSGYKDQYF